MGLQLGSKLLLRSRRVGSLQSGNGICWKSGPCPKTITGNANSDSAAKLKRRLTNYMISAIHVGQAILSPAFRPPPHYPALEIITNGTMSRITRCPGWPLRLCVIPLAIACWWIVSSAFGQNDSHEVPIGIIVVASESEAAQVMAQLKNGEDFGALARSKSTDPTANDAGYMGTMDPANLRPELRDALKGIARGQISPITKIPAGYAILKVLNEAPGGNPGTAAPGRTQALAAQSAILPTPDFAGYAEANLAFSRYPKPAGWENDIQSGMRGSYPVRRRLHQSSLRPI